MGHIPGEGLACPGRAALEAGYALWTVGSVAQWSSPGAPWPLALCPYAASCWAGTLAARVRGPLEANANTSPTQLFWRVLPCELCETLRAVPSPLCEKEGEVVEVG